MVKSLRGVRRATASDAALLSLCFMFLMFFALLCLYPISNMLALSFSAGFNADRGTSPSSRSDSIWIPGSRCLRPDSCGQDSGTPSS